MRDKFCLHGGIIRSVQDKDRHYISPYRVGELYHINREECINYHEGDLHIVSPYTICLYPRDDGNYRL